MAKFAKFERFGKTGTRWQFENGIMQRTDADGYGVWEYREKIDGQGGWMVDVVQTVGTCQFSLPDNDGSAEAERKIKAKIRRSY